MIARMTGHWKHPIAHVLQDKFFVPVQSQIIKDCIDLLYVERINVLAIVFDGTFSNQQTAVQLESKMVSDLQPWFPHCEQPSAKVYVIFDVCNMVMQMQNLLRDKKLSQKWPTSRNQMAIHWEPE